MATSAPSLSIVVITRNGVGRLPALLGGLGRQSLGDRTWELIVVDDGSTDGTAELVRQSGFARLVESPASGGRAAARNLGVDAARGETIAFIDDDCLPADDWAEEGLAALRESGADLIAGHIEVPLGDHPTASALVEFGRRYLDQELHVQHGFGATANLWVRREVFRRIGGFKLGLEGEDHDFGVRALSAGATLRYSPRPVVWHPPRTRPLELARKEFRLGFGAAQHRFRAEGGLERRPLIFTRPGAWIPDLSIGGRERLLQYGYRPGWRKRLAMRAVGYLCVQLPIAAGNLVGTLRERKAA